MAIAYRITRCSGNELTLLCAFRIISLALDTALPILGITMKIYIVLKLRNPTETLLGDLAQIGYDRTANKEYMFKPVVGQFDVIKLADFCQRNNMEGYFCDANSAQTIHGIDVSVRL